MDYKAKLYKNYAQICFDLFEFSIAALRLKIIRVSDLDLDLSLETLCDICISIGGGLAVHMQFKYKSVCMVSWKMSNLFYSSLRI